MPEIWFAIYLYSALAIFVTLNDDVLLIAVSVQSLQTLLHLCEAELIYLDMCSNSKKRLYVLDLARDST